MYSVIASIVIICIFSIKVSVSNNHQPPIQTSTSGQSQRLDSGSLKFIIMADWGGQAMAPYTTKIQLSTAARMEVIAKQNNISFILALGGNFFDKGVKDVEDSRFQNTFERVYNDYSLMVPWYVIAGNNDWLGNVSAQIQYTKHSHRWNFPFLFHPVMYDIPETEDTIDILMIDTTLLCGIVFTDFHDNQHHVPIDKVMAEFHWTWLESQLSKSRAKYLFTAGNLPVYTSTGSNDNCLVNKLLPLLSKYRANGHIAGHDHSLQHIKTKGADGVELDFIISGAASAIDDTEVNPQSIPEGSLLFHWADTSSGGGICLAEITSNNFTITFLNSEGNRLYQAVINPRKT